MQALKSLLYVMVVFMTDNDATQVHSEMRINITALTTLSAMLTVLVILSVMLMTM